MKERGVGWGVGVGGYESKSWRMEKKGKLVNERHAAAGRRAVKC